MISINVKHLSIGLLSAAAMLFGVTATAQSTWEFDARLDAASVYVTSDYPGHNHLGAAPGLRGSFSVTRINQVLPKTALLYGLSYAISGHDRGSVFWCGNSFDHLNQEETQRILEISNTTAERVDHLSLPIGVRQTFRQGRKWTIYGQAMLEPMVYLRTIYADGPRGEGRVTASERDDQAKRFQFAVGLAAGFERKVSDSWTLALRPTFRMHLTDSQRNLYETDSQAKHWTGGIALAIGHQF